MIRSLLKISGLLSFGWDSAFDWKPIIFVPKVQNIGKKQGKIDFKVDKSGIVHTSIGKVSFSPDQIRDNAKEFISTLIKLKPTAAKGTYIKSIYLSSTMSAGIKIDPKSVEEI